LFDHNVNEAMMTGKTVFEYGKGPALAALSATGKDLKKTL